MGGIAPLRTISASPGGNNSEGAEGGMVFFLEFRAAIRFWNIKPTNILELQIKSKRKVSSVFLNGSFVGRGKNPF